MGHLLRVMAGFVGFRLCPWTRVGVDALAATPVRPVRSCPAGLATPRKICRSY